MRHALRLSAVAAVLSLSGLPGCSNGGPSCLIDTDCPFGQRCGSDQACHVVGGDGDAGGEADAGRRDAGTPASDAATPSDAAIDADGGDVDAGDVDAGDVDAGDVDGGGLVPVGPDAGLPSS